MVHISVMLKKGKKTRKINNKNPSFDSNILKIICHDIRLVETHIYMRKLIKMKAISRITWHNVSM